MAYDAALERAPDDVNALNNKGNSLQSLADLQAMLSEHAAARASYGESILAYDAALERAPDMLRAIRFRGWQICRRCYQSMLRQYGESILAYDAALERAPDYVNALNNKGNSLQRLADLQAMLSEHAAARASYGESILAYDAALERAPDLVQALNNKGNSLQRLADLQTIAIRACCGKSQLWGVDFGV